MSKYVSILDLLGFFCYENSINAIRASIPSMKSEPEINCNNRLMFEFLYLVAMKKV